MLHSLSALHYFWLDTARKHDVVILTAVRWLSGCARRYNSAEDMETSSPALAGTLQQMAKFCSDTPSVFAGEINWAFQGTAQLDGALLRAMVASSPEQTRGGKKHGSTLCATHAAAVAVYPV